MGRFWEELRQKWLYMLEPKRALESAKTSSDSDGIFAVWYGWMWAVTGIFFGALFAPSIVQYLNLMNSPYQEMTATAIAVAVGFLTQLFGWCLSIPSEWLADALESRKRNSPRKAHSRVDEFADALDRYRDAHWNVDVLLGLGEVLLWGMVRLGPFVLPALTLTLIGYSYLGMISNVQALTVYSFAGGLLVKVFLLPFIKGIITGTAFRLFMQWLRGSNKKTI